MRTKDVPGFDRLTGFVTFAADLSARVRRYQGEPLAKEFSRPAGTCRDG